MIEDPDPVNGEGRCPHCGAKVPKIDYACPNCGQVVRWGKKPDKHEAPDGDRE